MFYERFDRLMIPLDNIVPIHVPCSGSEGSGDATYLCVLFRTNIELCAAASENFRRSATDDRVRLMQR
ncbi:hypothetical protein BZM27_53680 [Paraburkholderia steynii]|uniref:Uncharacterized protein n=1 Tax=Paraburkholderia steynii TaxID=1245441 RepID=A0A4R0X7W1_9BURK|nr:hypothetical protein BZM27_53680 [Paraburkholderia steynii]